MRDMEKIRSILDARGLADLSVYAREETESTNKDAREHYEATGEGQALFIADGQTAGRGRLGRSFASTRGAGIYMSLLLSPRARLAELVSMTAYVAVAVCRAIERQTGLTADIKWVNDIYYKGKKLGGILTEGVLADDGVSAKYVVVGIGLNVLCTNFPEEIRGIATTLEDATGERYDRYALAGEIAAEILSSLDRFDAEEIVMEYRRRSCLVGKDVTVHKAGDSYPAKVLGIEEDMSLRILLEDGSEERLATGEVSVRER